MELIRPCQSMMLDILPSPSTYMLPEWKSGCQKRGEERSESLGIMQGMAEMNLHSDDTWASGELCASDVNCRGFWAVLLGTACLLIQSISRLAMVSRYCLADFPITKLLREQPRSVLLGKTYTDRGNGAYRFALLPRTPFGQSVRWRSVIRYRPPPFAMVL